MNFIRNTIALIVGLGIAGLLRAKDMWFPVPGEGGHIDIGPRSERDFAIFPHLAPIEGRISAEQLQALAAPLAKNGYGQYLHKLALRGVVP